MKFKPESRNCGDAGAGVPLRLHTVAGFPLIRTMGNKRKLLDFGKKLTSKLAIKAQGILANFVKGI